MESVAQEAAGSPPPNSEASTKDHSANGVANGETGESIKISLADFQRMQQELLQLKQERYEFVDQQRRFESGIHCPVLQLLALSYFTL